MGVHEQRTVSRQPSVSYEAASCSLSKVFWPQCSGSRKAAGGWRGGTSSLIIPRWRGSSLPGRYKLGTWPVPPMRTIVLLADRLRRRLSEEHRTRRSDNGRTFGNNKWLGRMLRGRVRIKALDGKLAWTLRSTGELRNTGTIDTLRHSGIFPRVF